MRFGFGGGRGARPGVLDAVLGILLVSGGTERVSRSRGMPVFRRELCPAVANDSSVVRPFDRTEWAALSESRETTGRKLYRGRGMGTLVEGEVLPLSIGALMVPGGVVFEEVRMRFGLRGGSLTMLSASGILMGLQERGAIE